MVVGKVIGTAVSTIKHASMRGCKLLVVQPMLADRRTPDGDPLVAVDRLGAGFAEYVLLTSDGGGAREMLQTKATPVRWTVMGIEDE
jgi:ethanolamine utilization protein EutN